MKKINNAVLYTEKTSDLIYKNGISVEEKLRNVFIQSTMPTLVEEGDIWKEVLEVQVETSGENMPEFRRCIIQPILQL